MTSDQRNNRVPNRVEDLTAEWFSEILGQKVDESTFTVTPNDVGVGFMSTLVRVTFETVNGDLRHLVVKLLPEENEQVLGDTRKIVLLDHFDRTEIFIYKLLMPELIKDIPDIGKYLCEYLHGDICKGHQDQNNEIPYSSVLVLKDLRPGGYSMVNFAQDFQPSQFSQGLDFLSKLHAASLSLEKRLGISLVTAYPWFPKWYDPIKPGENSDKDSMLYSLVQDGYPDLYKLLELNPNTTQETYKKLKTVEINTRKIIMALIKAGQEFPCLIHGDLWPHNVLVHMSDDQAPIKALDWQMSGYTDPAYDVGIFLTLSLPLELMNEKGIFQKLLEYYKHNSELKKELGIENKRSWSEFEQFFKTYGLAYALFWWIMACPILRTNPKFKPKILPMLEVLTGRKVLDFVLSLI